MSRLKDYKQLELGLVSALGRLLEVATKLGDVGSQASLRHAVDRLSIGKFTLAVVGEFKRGKSTLINALLGEDILPTDVLPTTATLNRLVYGLEKRVTLHKHDGSSEEIAWDQLASYVTKLDDEAAVRAQAVREAVIHYPCNYCRNNVELIDTPGLQDEQAMSDITLAVLPKVDAAVMVISALSPLSESELGFLERLGQDGFARVFLVVTSIDRLADPGPALDLQIERLMSVLRQRLERLDPAIRRNLHPEIFATSPYQALRARKANDASAILSSRFPAFESALETFLGGERGRAALQGPWAVALRSVDKLRSLVEERRVRLAAAREDVARQLQAAEATASRASHGGRLDPPVWVNSAIFCQRVPWLEELRQVCQSRGSDDLPTQLERVYREALSRLAALALDDLYCLWDSHVDACEAQWRQHSPSRCPTVAASKGMLEQLRSLTDELPAELARCYPLEVQGISPPEVIARLEQSWTTTPAAALGRLKSQVEALLRDSCQRHCVNLDLVARDNAIERLGQLHSELARLEHGQARLEDRWTAVETAQESLRSLEPVLIS